MDKNDRIRLEINDLGADGEGVGRVNGMAVFVPGGLPGELLDVVIVKVKKSYCYGRLISVIRPSPARRKPFCPVFGRCGGCSLQHLDYPAQLEYKRGKIVSALQRIGGLDGIAVEATLGMERPRHYRNKAQFPIGGSIGESVAGFFGKRSHNVIAIDECGIQNEICRDILKIIIDFLNEHKIAPYDETTHTGILRHILIRTGRAAQPEVMVCLVINGRVLVHEAELVQRLRGLNGMKSIIINTNSMRTNVVLAKEPGSSRVLFGEGYINDRIGGLDFRCSPLSFLQVNPVQTEFLYQKVLELIGKKTGIIFDIYCGVGTISLYAAKVCDMVYGLESVPEAVCDAEYNAKKNNVANVEFITGTAEDMVRELIDNRKIVPDAVIVDPPRKGCDIRLLNALIEADIPRIIYVSCEPSTLARDMKILAAGGYRAETVWPFDCFPHTVKVECVTAMHKYT